jgi:hypothetical protein
MRWWWLSALPLSCPGRWGVCSALRPSCATSSLIRPPARQTDGSPPADALSYVLANAPAVGWGNGGFYNGGFRNGGFGNGGFCNHW